LWKRQRPDQVPLAAGLLASSGGAPQRRGAVAAEISFV
jgi:hypothetical protein